MPAPRVVAVTDGECSCLTVHEGPICHCLELVAPPWLAGSLGPVEGPAQQRLQHPPEVMLWPR